MVATTRDVSQSVEQRDVYARDADSRHSSYYRLMNPPPLPALSRRVLSAFTPGTARHTSMALPSGYEQTVAKKLPERRDEDKTGGDRDRSSCYQVEQPLSCN